MPRLSFLAYYTRHTELQAVWQERSIIFSNLHAIDQWYLHDYFRPSEKLTEAELRAYWASFHNCPGSLPQCAGRAYKKIRPFLLHPLESDRQIGTAVHAK